ncbi:unnamed protein product [Leptosia nina]|uniref:Cadherin domain-containing protein n=1 Tax=Leptosia nina TaxID=320188 RepID=A0AAV1J414_9NEOP
MTNTIKCLILWIVSFIQFTLPCEMGKLVIVLALCAVQYRFVRGDEPERCSYMINIPRLPKPDNLPDINIEGKEWQERPLFPAPERNDVCMDAYYPASDTSGTQIIYMDEEIKEPVSIARLNYRGTATPTIVQPLVAGTFSRLGPKIEKVDNVWHLIITQRQDFETDTMRTYMFEIEIPGERFIAIVRLQIVNIDDNAPIIQAFETCVVPELREPGPTSCVYEVTDEDGRISTSAMTFAITSDRNDDEVFHVIGGDISSDWRKMTMTIGLNVSLNYEMNALHIFRVTARDSLPNERTITMMVQVENVEHRVPRWVEIFAVQQFNEKTEKNFRVRAIDGDTGINKPIFYRIETKPEDAAFFDIETIEGGYRGATLKVKSIDRDALQRELFPISITAYKSNNESLSTTSSVVIIIDDVNDSTPEPLQAVYSVKIMEETAQTLNFDTEFGFNDKDLGENAQYTVRLESVHPEGAELAFFVAPSVGYQKQTFILGTQNHSMLDYEDVKFQKIQLRVIATDINRPNLYGVATVNIELINWNDEKPIFEESIKEVTFDETEGEGFVVGTMLANDRDINDEVVHSLLGNAQNYLNINSSTGEIVVSANNSFDYQRQNEIYVQVSAIDTLGEPFNRETAQLIIKLNDINNTPPRLTLPRRSPQVDENVAAGHVITEEITATDLDTTADLNFEIDWDTSYATKQGRATPATEYRECVEIQTNYPEDHRRTANGKIVVKSVRPGVTIDYEEFEMLYLTIRVIDRNTTLGDTYDESLFTVIIIDKNDNAPVWTESTLSQEFSIRENSRSDVVVGSVQANDIDGPLYNQVRYTLRTRNGTPENLIKIDLTTGLLSVDKDGAIDADEPRDNLYYTVIASDKCLEAECPPDIDYHDTAGEIKIAIVDTNNKVPSADTTKFNVNVTINENAVNGTEIVTLAAIDADRDAIYKTVRYQIQYAVNPRLRDFFGVDLDTGLVYVHYATDQVLDRDGDEPEFQIFFTLTDNFYSEGDGNRNSATVKIIVTLLDENDNAPVLPERDALFWSVSEGLKKGQKLPRLINAPDRDAPNTPNSRVGYEIVNLTLSNRDVELPDLFEMVTSWNEEFNNNVGEIQTVVDLKGYWGTYAIGIRAFDHGDPQLASEGIYSLVINPYNFYAPVFVFPKANSLIRLARERASVNGVLVTVSNSFLDQVQATDEDGLEAGRVKFEVVGDDEAAQFFTILEDRENQGILTLKQLFQETVKEFEITIRATDGGTDPQQLSTDVTFRVAFVPTQGDPVFTNPETTVSFIETEAGLSEKHNLPRADDPKNHLCEGDGCHQIFYRIIDGNENGFFNLDGTQNILQLAKPLNRTAANSHTIRVSASNSESAVTPLPASILTVNIEVREANPRPTFDRDLYTQGISTRDTINRVILTVLAVHSENAAITYTIDMSSMVVDPSLEAVKNSAFQLHPQTGVLTLTIQPTASMHGMFEFNVVATDSADATDTAQVKIYLISSQNRVFFMFMNTLEEIEGRTQFIESTFSSSFAMTCNVDQVIPATDDNGVARSDVTEVRAHFIQDNVPVSVEVIEKLRSDSQLLGSIQRILNTERLYLQDLVTGDSPTVKANTSLILLYVLGSLAAILTLMCIILLITFIVKTRALNRQLKALSMTKYGSQDSGLNRLGLAAPGTNKHAAEGSNPIWNAAIRAPDFDAISEDSGDSDLIGIEDLPQFRTDYFPPADTNSARGIVFGDETDKVSTHNNNFGFNPTPFSAEFANRKFGR